VLIALHHWAPVLHVATALPPADVTGPTGAAAVVVTFVVVHAAPV
jgi:hypothetical protein